MSADAIWQLEPIQPSPDGDLTFSINCRTSRGGRGKPHEVTIRATDPTTWVVDTGHDLERERIATAFGGYLSCLDLAAAMPALWHLAQTKGRRWAPSLKFQDEGGDPAGRVQLNARVGLAANIRPLSVDRGSSWDTATVADLFGVESKLLGLLIKEVEAAHEANFDFAPDDEWGANAVVDRDGLDALWNYGIHPQLCKHLAEQVLPSGSQMSASFYLGLVVRRPNLEWMAQTLSGIDDRSLAVWLAWTSSEFDEVYKSARLDWLWAGVSRRAIEGLVKGKYVPADVARLNVLTRWSVPTCASVLASWANADCKPTPAQVAALHTLDIDPGYRPSRKAVDWLAAQPAVHKMHLDRTTLGLVLALAGTRQTAMYLLRAGVDKFSAAANIIDGDGAIDETLVQLYYQAVLGEFRSPATGSAS